MRIPHNSVPQPSAFRQGLMLCGMFLCLFVASTAFGQAADAAPAAAKDASSFLNVRDMLAAGGTIGYVIMFLSFIMVALIIDNGACLFLQVWPRRFINVCPPENSAKV